METRTIPIKILWVNEKGDRDERVSRSLEQNPYFTFMVTLVRDLREVTKMLETGDFDLVVWEVNDRNVGLPHSSEWKTEFPEVPLLLLGNEKDEPFLHSLLAQGADEYILRNQLTVDGLTKSIRTAIDRSETARYRSQIQKLQSAYESFHKLLIQSVDGVVIVNADNIVQWVNPSVELFLEKKETDLLGKRFPFDLTSELTIETPVEQTNGDKIHIQIQVVEIVWDLNRAFLGVLRDITDRVRMDQRKDDFISTVSHELRTPMTVIREGVAQVEEGLHGPLTKVQKQFLGLTRESIDRLGQLIDDLLDVAKLEAQKMRCFLNRTDLGQLATQAIEAFRLAAGKKNIKILLDLPSKPCSGFVDASRLMQVLQNLLSNALKYTEKGSIVLSVREDTGGIRLAVKDTGAGISKRDLTRLFSKFEQFGRKEGGGPKGTGLGLAISKGLVELQGGKIEVTSEVGVGTTFTVLIPHQNIQEILVQYLAEEIETAQKENESFALIRCFFSEIDETYVASLENEVRDKILRKGFDLCFRDSDSLYLFLPRTTAKNVDQTITGFHGLIQEFVDKRRNVSLPEFYVSLFPTDGSTLPQLINKLFKKVKGESYGHASI